MPEPVGPVDVDPQKAGLADRVLVAPRRRPNRRSEEHLLAAVGVARGERQQRPQPVTPTRPSAGEEVVGAPAGRDLQPPVAPGARGDLDQPAGPLVQDAELQCAVALRTECPGEDASVSEPDAAASVSRAVLARCRAGAAVAAGIGSSLLRYGLACRRSRPGLVSADGGQVVAGDRLGLRAPVLVAASASTMRAVSLVTSRSSTCQSPSAVSRTTSLWRAPSASR